jgi:acyl-CoA synthetase (AMP-forming)/AMP-acid ligase II
MFPFIVGVMHAGLTPFPISARNSPGAIAHLLKATNASILYVSPDAAMRKLTAAAIKLLEDDSDDYKVKVMQMPEFADLYSHKDTGANDNADEDVQLNTMGPDDVALILHTSGKHSAVP